MRKRIDLTWQVGWTSQVDQSPQEWVESTVPGAVQLDWAKAQGWGPYWYGDNFKQYAWMENVFWHYKTHIPAIEADNDENLHFVSKGIDYSFIIKLNGKMIHEQEGMFTPVDLELTGKISGNDQLEVLILPVPKSKPDHPELFKPNDYHRQQANQSCKPCMNYGWDFVCRLIPLGIYDETFLEIRPPVYIVGAEIHYELADDFSYVDVQCECIVNNAETGKLLRWTVTGPGGESVIERETSIATSRPKLTARIDNPKLWWSHDQGEPALYRSCIELAREGRNIIDKCETRIGFRRVRLVHYNESSYHGDLRPPLTQNRPPMTVEINGRKIFCKGSNWVAPEIFPGLITKETYRPLLQLAKSANMNLLRLWGGSMVGKDSFYDLCDEMGIMLWQEFPLACNRYEGTQRYLRILDQESRSIIRRLRSHPSVIIWCGGNELFNPWSNMNEQDAAIRLLNRNCFDLDPHHPFLPTTPIMGVGHGDYLFRDWHGREVFEILRKADCSAYVEFGVPGAADIEVLKTFIPQAELFPPRHGTAWESHHGLGAWGSDGWLSPRTIEDYFGPSPDLETLVKHSQLMQCEGYKCLFEEVRRQKPRASMAINWVFNEPWPSAANVNLVSWPARPKPALSAVAASCRPILASARIPKFSWTKGETFSAELWILNDSPTPIESGMLKAYLMLDGKENLLLQWPFPPIDPQKNIAGPTAIFHLGTYRVNTIPPCLYL